MNRFPKLLIRQFSISTRLAISDPFKGILKPNSTNLEIKSI